MMSCPKCGTKLEVVNTYSVGGTAETRNLKCPSCGMPCSSVTFLVTPRESGHLLRKRISRGEIGYVISGGNQENEDPSAS